MASRLIIRILFMIHNSIKFIVEDLAEISVRSPYDLGTLPVPLSLSSTSSHQLRLIVRASFDRLHRALSFRILSSLDYHKQSSHSAPSHSLSVWVFSVAPTNWLNPPTGSIAKRSQTGIMILALSDGACVRTSQPNIATIQKAGLFARQHPPRHARLAHLSPLRPSFSPKPFARTSVPTKHASFYFLNQ